MWLRETREEQEEELHLLGTGPPGGRGQCELALKLYFSLILYDTYWGRDMERSQQVLENHLSRSAGLLPSLVRDAGSLLAQPRDVAISRAKHLPSLVCPQLSTQRIYPELPALLPGYGRPRVGRGLSLAFFSVIYPSIYLKST